MPIWLSINNFSQQSKYISSRWPRSNEARHFPSRRLFGNQKGLSCLCFRGSSRWPAPRRQFRDVRPVLPGLQHSSFCRINVWGIFIVSDPIGKAVLLKLVKSNFSPPLARRGKQPTVSEAWGGSRQNLALLITHCSPTCRWKGYPALPRHFVRLCSSPVCCLSFLYSLNLCGFSQTLGVWNPMLMASALNQSFKLWIWRLTIKQPQSQPCCSGVYVCFDMRKWFLINLWLNPSP